MPGTILSAKNLISFNLLNYTIVINLASVKKLKIEVKECAKGHHYRKGSW